MIREFHIIKAITAWLSPSCLATTLNKGVCFVYCWHLRRAVHNEGLALLHFIRMNFLPVAPDDDNDDAWPPQKTPPPVKITTQMASLHDTPKQLQQIVNMAPSSANLSSILTWERRSITDWTVTFFLFFIHACIHYHINATISSLSSAPCQLQNKTSTKSEAFQHQQNIHFNEYAAHIES